MFADPMMKDQIDNYIANNYASFDVQFQVHIMIHLKSLLLLALALCFTKEKRFAKGLKVLCVKLNLPKITPSWLVSNK
jgi:hypothetical protein